MIQIRFSIAIGYFRESYGKSKNQVIVCLLFKKTDSYEEENESAVDEFYETASIWEDCEQICGLSDGEIFRWVDCVFREEPWKMLRMMMRCLMAGHDSMCWYSCSIQNSQELTVSWNAEWLIQTFYCVLEVDSNFATRPKSHLRHSLHHCLWSLNWFMNFQ